MAQKTNKASNTRVGGAMGGALGGDEPERVSTVKKLGPSPVLDQIHVQNLIFILLSFSLSLSLLSVGVVTHSYLLSHLTIFLVASLPGAKAPPISPSLSDTMTQLV